MSTLVALRTSTARRCRCLARRSLSALPMTALSEELLPEGISGTLGKNQGLFYNGGGNFILEREQPMALIRAMEKFAHEVDPPLEEVDESEWTCGACGFRHYAGRHQGARLCCTRCKAVKGGHHHLPRRPYYIFTGARGTGKSVALSHVVHWARENHWIALFVPRGWDVANQGEYTVPSGHHEGFFEQPNQAKLILQGLHAAHGDKLDRLKVKDEAHAKRWKLNSGQATLGSLITTALNDKERYDELSTCVADVQAELAACTEFPVLVAIDEASSLYCPLTKYYFDGKALPPHKMIHIAALRAMNDLQGAAATNGDENHFAKPLRRGVTVYADSKSRQMKLWRPWEKTHPIDECALEMAPYSDDEFNAMVQRYMVIELTCYSLDQRQIDAITMATQRNPQLCFERIADLG